jgi:hypothetical protein
MSKMFSRSAFKGDLRPWRLTKNQISGAFGKTLPHYLAIRESIEEAEKLHATFGSTRRVKKAL